MKKSLEERINSLCKAGIIAHKDTSVYTDINTLSLATLSTPKEYQEYIQDYLKDIEPGETISIPLKDNETLKMFKVEGGIYSGHIQEEDGTISHNIDKVTIPEIASHLVGVDSLPLVEVQKEPDKKEDKNIVININISKSKENIMDLDERIDLLQKAEDNKVKVDKKEEKIIDEEATENKKKEQGRKNLISDMIGHLKSHHESGHSDNVKDVSKFMVHLHNSSEEKDKKLEKKTSMKKSDLEPCNSLTDIEKSKIKKTKGESKLIFDLELQDMIKNEYRYCKKSGKIVNNNIISMVKERVHKRIVQRMGWNDEFLLAKRAVNYDEKYLSQMVTTIDFEDLDTEIEQMEANTIQPMYFSKEKYKIFSERKGVSTEVLDVLEKGNNFFNKPLIDPGQGLGINFKEEVNYEELSKSKVYNKRDVEGRTNINRNILKK